MSNNSYSDFDNRSQEKDAAIVWLLQTLIKHSGQVNLYTQLGSTTIKSDDKFWAKEFLANQGYIKQVPNSIGVTFTITDNGRRYFNNKVYNMVLAQLAKADGFTNVSSILKDLQIENEAN